MGSPALDPRLGKPMLYRLSYVRVGGRISRVRARLRRATETRALAVGLAAAFDAAAHLIEEARAVGAVLVRDELARYRVRPTGGGGMRVPVWSIHGLPHPACGFCGRIACRPPPARSSSTAARARFSHEPGRARHSNEGSPQPVYATSTSFLDARHRGGHEGTPRRRDGSAGGQPLERHLGLARRLRQAPLAAQTRVNNAFPPTPVRL